MIIPRKSYTIQYKLAVLEYAFQYKASVACRKFHLATSMISRWKAQLVDLQAADKNKKRVGRPGRPVSCQAAENTLFRWFTEERNNLFPVTRSDVKEKMLRLPIS